MVIRSATDLREIASKILRAAGAPASRAQVVADSLVESDLTGHDSHGVVRVIEYVSQIRQGRIVPQAEPAIIRETATTLLVDGRWGFGQVVAEWTIQRIVQKAADHHIAAGGIFRCGHVGRAGAYPAMAAQRGFVGLIFVNGGGMEPRVTPHGGVRPVFGTNPLAAALPVQGLPPIVLDFSTSMVASGKIRLARDRGEEVPEGWILDRAGRPSRRPEDYYAGGMLLPAAGHKGYALSLLVEVLGGLLTGAGTPVLPESGYKLGNGVFFLAVNVESFRPLAEFAAQVRQLVDLVKSVPPAEGVGEVLLPGEPEERVRARRLAEGVPLADTTWAKIAETARSVGVEV